MTDANKIQTPISIITVADKKALPADCVATGDGIYIHPTGTIYGVLEEMSLNNCTATISTTNTSAVTASKLMDDDWCVAPKQSENSVYNGDVADELITKYKQLKANTPLNEDWKLKTNTYSEIIKDLIEWRSSVI